MVFNTNDCLGVGLPPTLAPPAVAVSPSRDVSKDTCLCCKKQGHWAKHCPSKRPTKSSNSTNYNIPVIHCPCGAGSCPVKTANTEKNRGRKFYSCPNSSPGCGFFEWLDKVQAPSCFCGAGACSILTETSGPNAGQRYYYCRIRKGFGACEFRQWVDSQVAVGGPDNKQIDKEKHSGSPKTQLNLHHYFMPPNMKSKSVTMDNGQSFSNSPVEPISHQKERAMLMENQNDDNLSSMPTSMQQDSQHIVAQENELIVPSSSNLDTILQEAETWIPSMKKTPRTSHFKSRFEIHCRQEKFWRHICAADPEDSPTGDVIHQTSVSEPGWLGRLVLPPARCLADPPSSTPILHCLDIEGSTSLLHRLSNATLDSSSSQSPAEELFTGVLKGLLGIKRSFNIMQEDFITGPILKVLKHTTTNEEELASGTFPLKGTLRLATSESTSNHHSSQELIERYEVEKGRFEHISRIQAEAYASFTTSEYHLKALHENASHLKDLLLQIETQLHDCEAESVKLAADVEEISKYKVKCKENMEVAFQEIAEALKHHDQWEEEQCANRGSPRDTLESRESMGAAFKQETKALQLFQQREG
ncbi:DNA topoisomerase [Quillaja saponaria]|uniref:DNA topoisomerase n=1 Tax=Quillaja saponaria TaxID=32244 RepID=A0AAD7PLL8_QUISA|nr:DNA topoisomerase [Quillaja saponaria]